ncbi:MULTISPECIES: hypothetical protein [Streptomyces]|uniref:hypothetical protein n=1 Tax=Streptomyces TaxID=1883 RepID=UPI001B374CC5|nr:MULTISPECIES: hypothetical protein [unclassified Streptomyces]MBQ0966160.1 hypothetical protein [Streptomyces sp. RK74B]MBQ1006093.1 hypothetical protein [Streptomyces sp. RK23]BET48402.1 hypothetical protein RGQ21_33840 [Kitasatospora aureofaciens]
MLKAQLRALLRDSAQSRERYETRNVQWSWRRFAAFAYVAEQYGYRYDGLSTLSPKGSPNPYFAFRRLPDAPERAAWSAQHYPAAPEAGPLPGMRPGGSRLRPLPEVQHEVDLLHARIMVDYSRTHRRRGLIALLVLMAAMLIPLSQTGFSAQSLLVCGAVWLFFAALWLTGLAIARHRYRKYSRVLRDSGVDWPSNPSLA